MQQKPHQYTPHGYDMNKMWIIKKQLAAINGFVSQLSTEVIS